MAQCYFYFIERYISTKGHRSDHAKILGCPTIVVWLPRPNAYYCLINLAIKYVSDISQKPRCKICKSYVPSFKQPSSQCDSLMRKCSLKDNEKHARCGVYLPCSGNNAYVLEFHVSAVVMLCINIYDRALTDNLTKIPMVVQEF